MSKKSIKVTRKFTGDKSLDEIIREYVIQTLNRQC